VQLHTHSRSALAFSENGYHLATGDDQGVVKLWDLRKLTNFHTLAADTVNGPVNGLSFDGSAQYLGVAANDTRLFGTKQWEIVQTYTHHKDAVTDIAFGAGNAFIATTSKDRMLKFLGA
jgi:pre-mRNA-processing factor 19